MLYHNKIMNSTNKIIDDNRISHMHGVAEYMYNNAYKHKIDKHKMYILGLLHDIGYIDKSKAHEYYGADIASQIGILKEYTDCIKYHSTTPIKYMNIKNCLESEIPKPLILLWEADMNVDITGKEVGYIHRLIDISNRHGLNSKQYKDCKETVKWLIKTKNTYKNT